MLRLVRALLQPLAQRGSVMPRAIGSVSGQAGQLLIPRCNGYDLRRRGGEARCVARNADR
jgi:hypothetical protein